MHRACMVVHSFYPDDPRVRRETEALLEDGWAVDVICLRGSGEPARECCDGAQVYRLPVRRHRGGGLAIYLLEYLSFLLLAAARLARLHLRERYAVVQIHNMPDFLVFAALVPRMLGARVVLDIHDLVPELYALKFGGRGHPAVGLTRLAERASAGFADQVITAGEPFRDRLVARGVPVEKVTVVMNTADPRLFQRPAAPRPRPAGAPLRMIYHGGLFERYGLDLAVRAVAQLRGEIPLELAIYGQGEAADELARLVDELGIGDQVRLGGFVPLSQIPSLIAGADLGVVPYRRNHFTDMLYPTKAFEYVAMGVPVIVSRTAAVEQLFGEIAGMYCEPESVGELSERMRELYTHPERRAELWRAQQAAYTPYAWEHQRSHYLGLMHRLCGTQAAAWSS